jgi:formate dehydrogenase subunit beta
MREIESRIRETVKDLFNKGKVDLVLGYEKGPVPFRSRPAFIEDEESADRLVWGPFCRNNLAVYLPRFFPVQANVKEKKPYPRIGVVAKGCDARSVNGLIRENQVPAENIIIIAVPCEGMLDVSVADFITDPGDVTSFVECEDGSFEVAMVSGEKKRIKAEDIVATACSECPSPLEEGAGVRIEGKPKESAKQEYEKLVKFESMSTEERWNYFREEVSRCIRCNACRQACPNCYCKVCFADQTKPRWLGAGDDITDSMMFHIGRIFHQAGRCVECDACVSACPMDIDLRLFTQKLGKDVKDLFGFVPGLSDEDLPLCTYKENDNQDFISEP